MNRTNKIINNILQKINSNYSPNVEDPYKQLLRTVLSQNTNRVNTATAFNRLNENFEIKPEILAEASKQDLIEAIRPAGMYNQRSEVIKQISQIVLEKFNSDLNIIMCNKLSDAREELMQFPGVGPKTADVVLMFSSKHHVIPVDRHIERVSKRLNLVTKNAKYDEIRKTLEFNTKPEKYKELHLKIIEFGRELCKSRNPKCNECFLYSLCNWPNKG